MIVQHQLRPQEGPAEAALLKVSQKRSQALVNFTGCTMESVRSGCSRATSCYKITVRITARIPGEVTSSFSNHSLQKDRSNIFKDTSSCFVFVPFIQNP